MEYPQYIDEIICRLEGEGESAYVVGGSLRDMIIGLHPHDFDVATSAPPQKTLSVFSDKKVIETGLRHGTVTVITDGKPVEITTFRVDGGYTDMRHPDSVSFTSDIMEDLSRRDFTVNAMAYNKKEGLIDPFSGRTDIQKRLLKAVGDPAIRFSEDALRIMRAFRFSAQLGFDIDKNTLVGISLTKSGLEKIARERIGSEFIRLLSSEFPCRSLRKMAELGILRYVMGECIPSDKLIDSTENLSAVFELRMAALLWDTDEEYARCALKELRLSGKQTTAVLATLRGAKKTVCTEKDARHLIASTGIYAEYAAELSEAMNVSAVGTRELVRRQRNTPCSLRELEINGKDLSEMGFRGKDIGIILNAVMARVIEEPELNHRELLLELVKKMTKNTEKENIK